MIQSIPAISHPLGLYTQLLLAVCILCPIASAQAQGPATETETPAWSRLRRDAKAEWRTPTDAEVTAAMQGVARSLDNVDRFLREQGQFEQQWRTYLLWETLQQDLAENAIPSPGSLRLAAHLLSGAAALVVPQQAFRDAAVALERAAVLITRSGTAEQEYVERTNQLIDVLSQVAASAEATAAGADGTEALAARTARDLSPVERGLVERHISWLDQRGLAEPFRAFCHRYRRPNFTLRMSQKLLNAAISQETTTQSDVRDSILGTTYVGSSTTQSKTSLELRPDATAVSMRLLSMGQVALRTTGHNDGSRVQTRSTTSFEGEKLIVWSLEGLKSSPATANARNRSQILDVAGRGAIGNRVARRRAYQQQAGTEGEVGARTAAVVRTEMDKAIEGLVSSLSNTYIRRLRIPLAARDALPLPVAMHSTDGEAGLQLLAANSAQLGSSTAPPTIPSSFGSTDATVQMHESVCNNLFTSYLAGRTISDEKIGAMMEEILGKFPEALGSGEDQKTWTIAFQATDPVVIGLRNEQLTVTVRADAFEVGNESYPGAIITAVYQRTPTAEGFEATMLKRLGVDVLSAEENEGQAVGVRQQVFRSMVRRRFARLFPQELRWHRLALPDPWPSGTQLRIVQSQISDGWLTLTAVCETSDEIGASGSVPSAG